ncbi:tetratricopeptide repeat protein [cf. Phormidesmis sp. LEGE 11477]|uniref:tetratricopeptide repeat protein n=1 Tax=cf. Phormidesmis sp. LEGE 11477 TaxID=1828680 RepID=UPI0018819783|nr:tetratricopeptide repeat protein [cf. Phormidesmis sp. LEGE 11477]MBE9061797.1 tetratricopeptide repeat protein [cf. Phormidesmis sp. LEGE 11477]
MPSVFFGSFSLLWLLGSAFWLWMLYECIRSGRQGQQWIWLLIFLNVIGAVMYFVTQWLPAHPEFVSKVGGSFGFVSRQDRDRLWQAEADAKNIGKPTQFITLGNLLFDQKQTEKALEAYQQALEQAPKNAKALWGAAQAAGELKDYSAAKDYLARLLAVDPEFSYGEASLAYGMTLYQMQDTDAALTHLQTHVKSWSSPEAYLMLAEIQARQEDTAAARETLETLIIKVKGFVPFQYRKNQHFVRTAERRLKALK